MFRNKFISALCGIAAILCIVNDASAARFKRSQSSIVIDAASGKVISASNADERRHPASLTKLMTLYLTFDALDKGKLKLTDKVKVSKHAAAMEPTKLGTPAGNKITVELAIKAMIIKSANDCAVVLAEKLGGSEDNFAKIMTKTAQELGMKHTTFKNASGLPHPSQKSTARDMAILGSAIYHHFPQYYQLFSNTKFSYQGKTFYTHNHLLKKYRGTDGMKTGYTKAAGYNIVTSAERDGKRVIAVVMGHNTIKERDMKVASLMTSGFKKIKSADNNKQLAQLDIKNTPQIDNIVSADNNITEVEEVTAKTDTWGIQIGAFSNYTKAHNYALSVQHILKPAYAAKTSVNVEPFSKGYSVVYRAQLIGLQKNEADKSCSQLQREKKSCIVVATDNKTQFAMVNQ